MAETIEPFQAPTLLVEENLFFFGAGGDGRRDTWLVTSSSNPTHRTDPKTPRPEKAPSLEKFCLTSPQPKNCGPTKAGLGKPRSPQHSLIRDFRQRCLGLGSSSFHNVLALHGPIHILWLSLSSGLLPWTFSFREKWCSLIFVRVVWSTKWLLKDSFGSPM